MGDTSSTQVSRSCAPMAESARQRLPSPRRRSGLHRLRGSGAIGSRVNPATTSGNVTFDGAWTYGPAACSGTGSDRVRDAGSDGGMDVTGQPVSKVTDATRESETRDRRPRSATVVRHHPYHLAARRKLHVLARVRASLVRVVEDDALHAPHHVAELEVEIRKGGQPFLEIRSQIDFPRHATLGAIHNLSGHGRDQLHLRFVMGHDPIEIV